jgi:hypothetical protein
MKGICILLAAIAPVVTAAEPTGTENSLASQLSPRFREAGAVSRGTPKANEVVKGSVTYSGILVQAVTTDNLLQLINPAAPAKYGSAEDNTLRDSVTGHAAGLKLFAIRF